LLDLPATQRILSMKQDPAKKTQTLAQMAADLRRGQHFNITRLTILKSHCDDPQATAKFALHIAKLVKEKVESGRSGRSSSAKCRKYKGLIAAGVRAMAGYLRKPTDKAKERLWDLHAEVKQTQSRYEHQRWGAVRIIECWELLIVETAMECVLRPWYSSHLGYQLARQYAEEYDSRYPSGLVPKSAPMVEEIAEFWGRYYLGRGWRKRVQIFPSPRP
jgi:hypothetical protein